MDRRVMARKISIIPMVGMTRVAASPNKANLRETNRQVSLLLAVGPAGRLALSRTTAGGIKPYKLETLVENDEA